MYLTNLRNAILFPNSKHDGYIEHGNFRDRTWKVVLNGLVNDAKIRKYLKPYALRHSFISRLVHQNWDIKTVATLVGNSPDVIIKNYLGAKENVDVPPL